MHQESDDHNQSARFGQDIVIITKPGFVETTMSLLLE